MKKIILFIVINLLLVSCKNEKTNSEQQKHNHNNAPKEKIDEPKKKPLSPHTAAMAMVGDAHVHIDYSSPGVRGRIIFGGLVAYDSVWQTGAHNATWIETTKDLTINGKLLPKGKYGFFTIPSKKDWTVIFNKNWEQHGKDDYDQKEDVIRFKVTPTITEAITEHLEYKVTKTNESEGVIYFAWEKATLNIPFKVVQ
ncbi:MAG: hypothetical protein ACI9OE_002800 [Mariniflexile sp.]|jgi:hypothetical protein